MVESLSKFQLKHQLTIPFSDFLHNCRQNKKKGAKRGRLYDSLGSPGLRNLSVSCTSNFYFLLFITIFYLLPRLAASLAKESQQKKTKQRKQNNFQSKKITFYSIQNKKRNDCIYLNTPAQLGILS